MKKKFALISIILVIGFSFNMFLEFKKTNNFAIFEIFNEKKYLDDETYDEFILRYNIITEKSSKIISEYKDFCGLGDIPEKNITEVNFTFSENDLYNIFEEIKFDCENDEYEKINELYEQLYFTIEPLYESYLKAQKYYGKNIEKMPESNYIHRNFIGCYVNFKNAYNDFSNEIYKVELN